MQQEPETQHVGTFGIKKANDEVARPQIGGQEHAQVYHLSHIARRQSAMEYELEDAFVVQQPGPGHLGEVL